VSGSLRRNEWTRTAPGLWTSNEDDTVQVATACECRYTGCAGRWQVLCDRLPYSVQGTLMFRTRAEAIAEAAQWIHSGGIGGVWK